MSAIRPQLGLFGAVAIGLASMLGAGVFAVFSGAAKLAGEWLFLATLIAAVVAALNALSVLQLARQVDRPGGVYSYSRVYLTPQASFVAGFSFVLGKTGSIAAISLTFAEYAFPGNQGVAASAAVVALTVLNLFGINRTATFAGFFAVLTVVFLLFSALSGLAFEGHKKVDDLSMSLHGETEFIHVFGAAAVIFFAFAGYARVATLGHDVKNPKRNIPIAIALALAVVLVLYILLVFGLQNALGGSLSSSSAVFVDLLSRTAPWFPTQAIIAIAAMAALGSLLSLLAGVSRTAATMAVDGEFPGRLSERNRHGAPWLAESIIAIAAIALIQFDNLIWVIGFSSFSVLIYYGIGHLSSIRQPKNERLMPRWLNWIGVALCIALVSSIPGPAIPISVILVFSAIAIRALMKQRVAKPKDAN
ncbi:MAG: hypothetical protein RL174_154 [Actinomycetota bacterium]|jgi:APA family basic amino acid/polyamine antiporter